VQYVSPAGFLDVGENCLNLDLQDFWINRIKRRSPVLFLS
jgi:hypothetical protein